MAKILSHVCDPVTPEAAEQVAMVMAGLGAPSRFQILERLRKDPAASDELFEAQQIPRRRSLNSFASSGR